MPAASSTVAYETSAACTASACRWSTRSPWTEVEVARGQQLYRQRFERGKPSARSKDAGQGQQPARHQGAFKPDEQIFGKNASFSPPGCTSMARPRPISSAAWKSAGPAIPLIKDKRPGRRRCCISPAALQGLPARAQWADRIACNAEKSSPASFREGQAPRSNGPWPGSARGRLLVVLLQHHPHTEGGTHEQGCARADQGL
jgi:topoisomerase-4 subunit B